MKTVNFEKAKQEYNKIMFDYCWEHCSVGTPYSENTEGWNLRDMVSEAQYHLDTCYEDGHSESEGRYFEYWKITAQDMLSKEKTAYILRHNKAETELHEDWLRKTKRLRVFINRYKGYIENMKCVCGHCSDYD